MKTTAKPTVKRDPNKRSELIKVGVALFTEKSFYNTTVDEIVALGGVPKGSFHYYFGTKDVYVFEVIQAYSAYFLKKLDRWLGDQSMDPIERIRMFTDDAANGMVRHRFKRGCLVGNLSQELGALDQRFRIALLSVLNEWRGRIQSCLDEAKETGHIHADLDTACLAQYFWNAWEGAVLCSKLEESRAPLDQASDAFIRQLARP